MEIIMLFAKTINFLILFGAGYALAYYTTQRPVPSDKTSGDKVAVKELKVLQARAARANSGPVKPLSRQERVELEDAELQRFRELTK